jgi:hypothetical protein
MPRLQIEIDAATTEAVTSLAGERGSTPADLVVTIVERYIHDSEAAVPDPLDTLVGSVGAEPVDDIDEVNCGR